MKQSTSFIRFFFFFGGCKTLLFIVLTTFFGVVSRAQIPKNGLVAYYPFTGNAYDSSGNGYHGTTNNVTLTSDRFGRANCAYEFTGFTNSYIEIPSTGLKNNNYSYSVWIKINSLGMSGDLTTVFEVAKGGNATGQAITVANNYLSSFNGINGGGYNQSAIPSAWVVSTKKLPSTSRWYHVVFARGDKFQYLYVDGVLRDSFRNATSMLPEYGNPVKAMFGVRCNYIQPFNGVIDDGALYNRVITPCEVLELYTGKPGYTSVRPGLSKAILHRACLDRVTGELNLLMTPSKDTFSNFAFYRIWGRDNAAASFQLLHQETSINKQNLNLSPPNKKRWEIYVSTHWNACKNLDSVISNTVFVDNIAPSYIEPDSVSVDLITQKVIAGWTSPSDADIMGYSLFKVDAVGNNQLIDEQNVLCYQFNTGTFDSKVGGNRLAIAAYDSCRNGGIISKSHSPILLSYELNNNYLCNKNIRFEWTNYVGWSSGSQLVIIEDMDAGTVIGKVWLNGTDNSLDWTLPYFGFNIRIYVRAFKLGNNSISSTSNIVVGLVGDFPQPTTLTSIDWISVESEPNIELKGRKNAGDSAVLYFKDFGASTWNVGTLINKSNSYFLYNHTASNSSNGLTDFKLVRYNHCKTAFDSSTIYRNILLSKNTNKELIFSPHSGWKSDGLSHEYRLMEFKNGNWSLEGTLNESNPNYMFTPTGYGVRKFRIKSVSFDPVYGSLNWSYSNVIQLDMGFDSSQVDTFLIPNAFTPGGVNPVFKVSNPAVLRGEAQMYIYNRWGEIFYRCDALEGWDGTDGKGELVPDGIYVYVIEARYRRQLKYIPGTIMVLK